MADITLINLGSQPNDGTGDSLRVAGGKVNENFLSIQEELELLTVDNLGERVPGHFHVSKDGDDDNVGTSPGSAVLTVRKAVELANAYVAENETQAFIEIHPGTYEEVLPITVRRDVAIYGVSLRSVELKPAAGYQFESFFKVDSGFKLWGISFIGHQADSVRQSWCVEFDSEADNTSLGASGLGAYITKSPYIQNCTSYTAEDDSGEAGSVSTGNTGGGLKVDGAACASNSPIRSMVVDSFTQVNLGGPGCLVTNDGYAQLVSFFGTFCEYHCKAENGGQVNFTGGTTDFGNYGLIADGYSPTPIYTATAQRDHYGVERIDKQFTPSHTTDTLTSAAHGLSNNDRVTLRVVEGNLPAPLLTAQLYYVVNATTDTFQLSLTEGGAVVNITGVAVGTEQLFFVRQGELIMNLIGFSQSRVGTDVRPGNGVLAFPRLVFPRTGSLGHEATPGTVESVVEDTGVFYARMVLDTAPATVGKHRHVAGTGTITVTRPGVFVTPEGNPIETTPIAGLNTYTFNLVEVEYDHLTGITLVNASNYLPAVGDIVYFTNAQFICDNSALVVQGSAAIDSNGNVVAVDSPAAIGYQVNFYNPRNGGLQYPLVQGQVVDFRNRSQIVAPAHVFEYVGSGTNYLALPQNGGVPKQENAYQELNQGRVFLSWINEKGDFGISNRFLVDGTTGAVTIDASTFNLSGLNQIGPFSRNGGLSTVGVVLREISDNASLVNSLGLAGSDTVPTQRAVAGYVSEILTGAVQFNAIFINGVVIFAVGSTAEYPTTRPSGQALQVGDILWDATAQDWVRYNGSDWNSEVKAIVKSDGLGGYTTNYDFRVDAEPTIRPDGLTIQEGDRWERPGFFIAYRDASGNWVAATAENVFYSGTLQSVQSTTTIRSSGNFSDVDSDANNVLYMLSGTTNFTYNSLDVSTDFGQTWNVLNTFSPITSTIGTNFYINRVTGSFYSVGTGFMVSRDQGATWVASYSNNRGVLYFKSNGHVVIVATVFNTNAALSTNDGVSWTQVGNVSTNIPAISNTSGATGVLVDDNTLLLAPPASSNLGIARSTDGGATWTHTIPTGGYTLADHKGPDGTIYGTLTGTGSVYSTDGGLTWLPGGVGLASLIDDIGTVYYLSKPGGNFDDSITKTPYSTNNVNSDIQHFRFNAFVQGFEIGYSSGGTNNASNYYVITFQYKESTDVSWTSVQITLNSPYPSPTPASIYFPLNEYWPNGGMFRFAGAASVGNPSSVQLTIVATGNRIYV